MIRSGVAKRATSTSATRSAAWPSHSGIAHGVGSHGERPIWRIAVGSSPSSVFVPCDSVTGRSVLGRNVKHAMPSAAAYSCTPPESVRIAPAKACSERKSR